jgi:hypothetical protein
MGSKFMHAEPAATSGNSELRIGDLEPYEHDWGFTVFGPHNEPLTHFVSVTREQAERAREAMFAVLGSEDDVAPPIHFEHAAGPH